MSIVFPTALDNFSNPTASSDLSNPSHSQQHADLNDAVEALQLKVGITNSADTNSLDYKIANVVGGGGSGTVTSVSVTTANGVSGSVATATTTPAITLTLGAITPSAIQVSGLTASQILSTDASKNLTSLAVATYPSLTELAFVKGVTSAIQTQINAKGAGTVTAVSVASANGVSGSSSGGATPALTIALGAITPTTVNSVTISGSSTPTLAVTGTTTVSGSNSGDSAGHTGLATLASPTFTGTVVVPTPFTVGAVSMTATGTELNYVSGVTSAIQTQLNTKAPTSSPTFTGTVTLPIGLTGVIRTDTGVVSVDTDVTDIVSAASTSAAGKVELAITSEIDTGTDSTRAMPVDQFVASKRNVRYVIIRVLDSTTDWPADGTTSVGGAIPIPFTGTLVEIYADSDTAGTTGTAIVDVNIAGTTTMGTNKLKWDSTETSTRTYSGTAPAISNGTITAGQLITIDVDTNHTTKSKGLVVTLGIRQS